MPNWSFNYLVIRKAPGATFNVSAVMRELHPNPELLSRDSATRVVEALKPSRVNGPVLSFERLLPTPESELEGDGWYSWRVTHWGTKWDAHQSRVEYYYSHVVVYSFLTAWSPPEGWFVEFVRQHPGCDFELAYVEEAEDFAGVYKGSGGEVWHEEMLSREVEVLYFGDNESGVV